MKVAVIGATGMVGRVLLDVLSERKFPIHKLLLAASVRSVGKQMDFEGKSHRVMDLQTAVDTRPDLALFSAGGETSKIWAPKFAAVGTTVIDNSSAWRMDPDKKLIVPEINAEQLTHTDKIIANPNCSTIQLVMALAPLHRAYTLKRIVISTYQSITGTGVKAVEQLENEYEGKKGDMAYPYPIHRNALPQCDVFVEDGYTREELKLVNETHKILNDDSIGITATAIRIPVVGGHSEAVNVTFEKDFELTAIREHLQDTPGLTVQDQPHTATYPMPIYAEGKDDVFVGRIRRDFSQPNSLNLWIVADNLRKGAATNAVQIAQHLLEKGLL